MVERDGEGGMGVGACFLTGALVESSVENFCRRGMTLVNVESRNGRRRGTSNAFVE